MPANCSSSVPWIPCAKRGVLPAVSPAPKTPNGWSTPSGPSRARAGARLCGPLYAPRGPLQQPAAGYRKRSGPFPVERLSGGRPDQNDDFIGRRVHPAVLTARVAERLPTHSLLRLSGKSLPATETCPVSPLTRHADAKPRHRCHAGAGLPRPLRTPHQLFVAAVSAMLARSHGNRRHPAKIREMSLPCSNHHRFVMSATPDPKLATPWGWPRPVWGRSVTWTFRYRGTRFNTVPKAPYWLPILSFWRSLSDSLSALRASHMPTLHLLLSKPDDSKLIVRPVVQRFSPIHF